MEEHSSEGLSILQTRAWPESRASSCLRRLADLRLGFASMAHTPMAAPLRSVKTPMAPMSPISMKSISTSAPSLRALVTGFLTSSTCRC